jgi:hypothetical protein
MKRVIIMSLIGGSFTAGLIYAIHRLQRKNAKAIQLDFIEYALGG